MCHYIRLIIIFLLFTLVGCATARNHESQDLFWKTTQQTVIIAETMAPQPVVYKIGNQGLLDYDVINSTSENSIDDFVKQINLSWYREMPADLATQMKLHNFNAVIYQEPIKLNKKEYAAVKQKTGGDALLVLTLEAIGAKRDYFGFVAKGAPEAYCVLTGDLINLHNNKVIWHYTATIVEPILAPWDQAPHYANYSSALRLAINSAKQELEDSLFSAH